jgi:hypothetical protein
MNCTNIFSPIILEIAATIILSLLLLKAKKKAMECTMLEFLELLLDPLPCYETSQSITNIPQPSIPHYGLNLKPI